MAELDRIKQNVAKMAEMNAPEADIDGYIQSEGVSIEDVRNYQVQSPQPATPPSMTATPMASFSKGIEDMASFGYSDELRAMGAGAGGYMRGQGFDNVYNIRLEQLRNEQKAAQEQNPYYYGAGQITGAVGAPAIGIPKAIAQGIGNVASRGILQSIAISSGLGAASGSLYGAGTGGEEGKDRVYQALVYGAMGGIGGVGGVAASRLIGRAIDLFARKTAKLNSPVMAKNIKTPVNATKAKTGELLDLTTGQATQDAKKQAIEISALKGGIGDVAQNKALKAQSIQQGQIRGTINTFNPNETALETASQSVKGAFKQIKHAVNKAYDDARITQNVYVNKAPIDEIFRPQVEALMKNGGYDIGDLTPRATNIIKQITDKKFYKDKKITSYNLEKMEFWRRRASNASNDAFSRGDKSEGWLLKEIVYSYDNFMGKIPEHSLLSGDASAIEAINKARVLRRMQGVLFERNKIVKNLVDNTELTNEELANIVLTGSKASERINKGAGAVVKNMRKTLSPEKQGAFIENLKRGTMARVLLKSEGTELVDGVFKIMPNKMIKELDSILNNKTFANELFSEGEQKMLNALKNDLVKINSVKAGADNYSNTAYAVMRFLDDVPFGGFGVASGASKLVAEPMAKKGARGALDKNLANVLSNAKNQLKGERKFYGMVAGGEVIPQAIENYKESK